MRRTMTSSQQLLSETIGNMTNSSTGTGITANHNGGSNSNSGRKSKVALQREIFELQTKLKNAKSTAAAVVQPTRVEALAAAAAAAPPPSRVVAAQLDISAAPATATRVVQHQPEKEAPVPSPTKRSRPVSPVKAPGRRVVATSGSSSSSNSESRAGGIRSTTAAAAAAARPKSSNVKLRAAKLGSALFAPTTTTTAAVIVAAPKVSETSKRETINQQQQPLEQQQPPKKQQPSQLQQLLEQPPKLQQPSQQSQSQPQQQQQQQQQPLYTVQKRSTKTNSTYNNYNKSKSTTTSSSSSSACATTATTTTAPAYVPIPATSGTNAVTAEGKPTLSLLYSSKVVAAGRSSSSLSPLDNATSTTPPPRPAAAADDIQSDDDNETDNENTETYEQKPLSTALAAATVGPCNSTSVALAKNGCNSSTTTTTTAKSDPVVASCHDPKRSGKEQEEHAANRTSTTPPSFVTTSPARSSSSNNNNTASSNNNKQRLWDEQSLSHPSAELLLEQLRFVTSELSAVRSEVAQLHKTTAAATTAAAHGHSSPVGGGNDKRSSEQHQQLDSLKAELQLVKSELVTAFQHEVVAKLATPAADNSAEAIRGILRSELATELLTVKQDIRNDLATQQKVQQTMYNLQTKEIRDIVQKGAAAATEHQQAVAATAKNMATESSTEPQSLTVLQKDLRADLRAELLTLQSSMQNEVHTMIQTEFERSLESVEEELQAIRVEQTEHQQETICMLQKILLKQQQQQNDQQEQQQIADPTNGNEEVKALLIELMSTAKKQQGGEDHGRSPSADHGNAKALMDKLVVIEQQNKDEMAELKYLVAKQAAQIKDMSHRVGVSASAGIGAAAAAAATASTYGAAAVEHPHRMTKHVNAMKVAAVREQQRAAETFAPTHDERSSRMVDDGDHDETSDPTHDERSSRMVDDDDDDDHSKCGATAAGCAHETAVVGTKQIPVSSEFRSGSGARVYDRGTEKPLVPLVPTVQVDSNPQNMDKDFVPAVHDTKKNNTVQPDKLCTTSVTVAESAKKLRQAVQKVSEKFASTNQLDVDNERPSVRVNKEASQPVQLKEEQEQITVNQSIGRFGAFAGAKMCVAHQQDDKKTSTLAFQKYALKPVHRPVAGCAGVKNSLASRGDTQSEKAAAVSRFSDGMDRNTKPCGQSSLQRAAAAMTSQSHSATTKTIAQPNAVSPKPIIDTHGDTAGVKISLVETKKHLGATDAFGEHCDDDSAPKTIVGKASSTTTPVEISVVVVPIATNTTADESSGDINSSSAAPPTKTAAVQTKHPAIATTNKLPVARNAAEENESSGGSDSSNSSNAAPGIAVVETKQIPDIATAKKLPVVRKAADDEECSDGSDSSNSSNATPHAKIAVNMRETKKLTHIATKLPPIARKAAEDDERSDSSDSSNSSNASPPAKTALAEEKNLPDTATTKKLPISRKAADDDESTDGSDSSRSSNVAPPAKTTLVGKAKKLPLISTTNKLPIARNAADDDESSDVSDSSSSSSAAVVETKQLTVIAKLPIARNAADDDDSSDGSESSDSSCAAVVETKKLPTVPDPSDEESSYGSDSSSSSHTPATSLSEIDQPPNSAVRGVENPNTCELTPTSMSGVTAGKVMPMPVANHSLNPSRAVSRGIAGAEGGTVTAIRNEKPNAGKKTDSSKTSIKSMSEDSDNAFSPCPESSKLVSLPSSSVKRPSNTSPTTKECSVKEHSKDASEEQRQDSVEESRSNSGFGSNEVSDADDENALKKQELGHHGFAVSNDVFKGMASEEEDESLGRADSDSASVDSSMVAALEGNSTIKTGWHLYEPSCEAVVESPNVLSPPSKPTSDLKEGGSEEESEEESIVSESEESSCADAEEEGGLVAAETLSINDKDELALRKRALALLGIGVDDGPAREESESEDEDDSEEEEESSEEESECEEPSRRIRGILRKSSFEENDVKQWPRGRSKNTLIISENVVTKEIPKCSIEDKASLFYDKDDIKRMRYDAEQHKEKKELKRISKLGNKTAIDSLPSFWD